MRPIARLTINNLFEPSIINIHGEVSEWLMEHAWKVCKRFTPFRGLESLPLRQERGARPLRSSVSLFVRKIRTTGSGASEQREPASQSDYPSQIFFC